MQSWPEAQRVAWFRSLTNDQRAVLRYSWKFWGRPEQQAPPGEWLTHLILAGRGWGKSRTGAEWVIDKAREGGPGTRIALIGATTPDVRDVMVRGNSGILACSSPWFMPVYTPSKRLLVWPNGAIASTYSADSFERLRGPQHHYAWCDELCAWRYSQEAWDQMMFGLRLGIRPQVVVTTTPKPIKLIRDLVKDETTHVTRGSTYDNLANLAPSFRDAILKKYEGTRLGRQEINAEILDDNPGALLTRAIFDAHRVTQKPSDLKRVSTGVDPSVSNNAGSNGTGIVTAGVGRNGHYYVLADDSMHAHVNVWSKQVVSSYYANESDRVVAEVNNGGDLVEALIKVVDPKVVIRSVRASRGKQTRAEPIAQLYEQGQVHHVGFFPHLEDEWCIWDPMLGEASPDRLDACVWAITDLLESPPARTLNLNVSPARTPNQGF